MDNQERKQKIHEWVEALKSGEYNPSYISDKPDARGWMFITSIYPELLDKKDKD